jgi:hypothetical protein
VREPQYLRLGLIPVQQQVLRLGALRPPTPILASEPRIHLVAQRDQLAIAGVKLTSVVVDSRCRPAAFARSTASLVSSRRQPIPGAHA